MSPKFALFSTSVSGSDRQKVGDENEKQQAVKDEANQRRGEDSFLAVLADAKQGRDAQTDSSDRVHFSGPVHELVLGHG